VCGAGSASPLCQACLLAISPIAPPHCHICGQSTGDRLECSHCSRHQPSFTAARSLGAYDGVLKEAVHRLKYRDRPQLAEPLGIALAQFARETEISHDLLAADLIIPVPMSAKRQRLRGYNQAERLARVVAHELDIGLDADALKRVKSSRPQVGLKREARQRNLAGAFAVANASDVAGKTIVVIDDVTTTNSTIDECAKVLKAAGARAVYGLTLAAG